MHGEDISMLENSWGIAVSEAITSKNYVRCHQIFPWASEIAEVGWECYQLEMCPNPPGALSLTSS